LTLVGREVDEGLQQTGRDTKGVADGAHVVLRFPLKEELLYGPPGFLTCLCTHGSKVPGLLEVDNF
jgi:hypothetical protein